MKVTAVVPSYEPDEKLIQVVDGLLRAVGVDLDERIDVVERIEQKMGVELAFEVLQFGLRAAVFQLLPGRFGFFQLLRQIRAFLRERVHLPGKRGVVRLCLLQTLLQTCQFDLKARIFSGKLIALVGQLAQRLLVLDGGRFDIIDDVSAVKAADRRAEL